MRGTRKAGAWTRFGRDGFVFPDFGGRDEGAYGLAVQPDGKIVVVGYSEAETWDPSVWVTDFVVARYLPDGKPDATFGAGGQVLTHFGAESSDIASAVSVEDNGKIVVAGSAGAGFALARYASDGKLDPSFGSDGKVLTPFGAKSAGAYSMRVQGDGGIVAAGQTQASGKTRPDVAVARYLPDGSLDPSFGSGGKVTTDFGQGTFDEAYGIATQADGRTVVAGRTGPVAKGPFHFIVVRYLRDGALDSGFGKGGKVETAFGAKKSDWATGLALQPDGRILVAGVSGSPKQVYRGDFALARYLPDGSLDHSFGGDGKIGTDFARASTQVVSFTAKRTSSGIRVRWTTAWEVNARGFDLMRYGTASGPVRVNAKLIAPKGSAVRGASYSVLDRRASKASLSYVSPREEGRRQHPVARRARAEASQALSDRPDLRAGSITGTGVAAPDGWSAARAPAKGYRR